MRDVFFTPLLFETLTAVEVAPVRLSGAQCKSHQYKSHNGNHGLDDNKKRRFWI